MCSAPEQSLFPALGALALSVQTRGGCGTECQLLKHHTARSRVLSRAHANRNVAPHTSRQSTPSSHFTGGMSRTQRSRADQRVDSVCGTESRLLVYKRMTCSDDPLSSPGRGGGGAPAPPPSLAWRSLAASMLRELCCACEHHRTEHRYAADCVW